MDKRGDVIIVERFPFLISTLKDRKHDKLFSLSFVRLTSLHSLLVRSHLLLLNRNQLSLTKELGCQRVDNRDLAL